MNVYIIEFSYDNGAYVKNMSAIVISNTYDNAISYFVNKGNQLFHGSDDEIRIKSCRKLENDIIIIDGVEYTNSYVL